MINFLSSSDFFFFMRIESYSTKFFSYYPEKRCDIVSSVTWIIKNAKPL